MNANTTRRGLLAALVGGGVAGAALSPARGFLDGFAPLGGRVWRSTGRRLPGEVESPYGEAAVTYDDYGVPHVEADEERAAYYAVGYVHAADRLFGMDLIRRQMEGTLAAAVGEPGVADDEFAAKMDFPAAARASEQVLEGTDAHELLVAYRDGVNAYVDERPLPLEFGLLDYEPREWTIEASLLVGLQIAWGLTGSFGTLRRSILRERLDEGTFDRLYPERFDHGEPILRDGEVEGEISGVESGSSASVGPAERTPDPALVDRLARFEPPDLLGSNSWVVSGVYTESGEPVVCNDPHLTLMVPPVWYEQQVRAGGANVRGVAFPGIPFVIIGENDHCAWGFTNTGADVIDFYSYEVEEEGERYRYRGEWREFDRETRTIEVAGGGDREIDVKKTVHGAYIEEDVGDETRHVGVAWTGLSGTREADAIYRFAHAESLDEFRSALELFDAPTQNVVYADRDGRTLFHVTGKIPIRQVDGEIVGGGRVFDGSAGEAEWEGFTPYGESSWDGFVPFEEKPGVVDPDVLATANQRVADDPEYPIGHTFASGFRGLRIHEVLDEAVGGGTLDREFQTDLQTDTLDVRARMLVPEILDARAEMPEEAEPWLDALANWDYHMDRDSAAALVFHRWYDAFREATWTTLFRERGLDDADFGESYWPSEWVLVNLAADDESAADQIFDGDRTAVMADAMGEAVAEIDDEGWEVYGDYNRTAIEHPFGGEVSALNYPEYPTDGTGFTVKNFHDGAVAGASWRMISPMDGDSLGIVPGGNDGSYFSAHYDDQLRMWADGEYKPLSGDLPDEEPTTTFRGAEE